MDIKDVKAFPDDLEILKRAVAAAKRRGAPDKDFFDLLTYALSHDPRPLEVISDCAWYWFLKFSAGSTARIFAYNNVDTLRMEADAAWVMEFRVTKETRCEGRLIIPRLLGSKGGRVAVSRPKGFPRLHPLTESAFEDGPNGLPAATSLVALESLARKSPPGKYWYGELVNSFGQTVARFRYNNVLVLVGKIYFHNAEANTFSNGRWTREPD